MRTKHLLIAGLLCLAKGSLKGHISLSYFSTPRVADNYQQQLNDLSIEARIVTV